MKGGRGRDGEKGVKGKRGGWMDGWMSEDEEGEEVQWRFGGGVGGRRRP